MASNIFISYRREDARHAAGRLVDRLGQTFRKDQLFIDVDNIAPGLDFRKELAAKVEACDVLLAVIGPGWIDAKDADGQRRLDDPKDFVRIEIEAALARDIRVIPVLVDGADMPKEDQLPEPTKPLAFRNATRLTHERFAADADGLANALKRGVVFGSASQRSSSLRRRVTRTVVIGVLIATVITTGLVYFASFKASLPDQPSPISDKSEIKDLTPQREIQARPAPQPFLPALPEEPGLDRALVDVPKIKGLTPKRDMDGRPRLPANRPQSHPAAGGAQPGG